MLDQIRRDIQARLDELLGEIERLRDALGSSARRTPGTPELRSPPAQLLLGPARGPCPGRRGPRSSPR
ncbi:MAG: hypothetical protein ACLP01_13275 [Solirubrobacteraceae bacterium]